MDLKSVFSFLYQDELQELESCKEEIEELKKIIKLNDPNPEVILKELKWFSSKSELRQWLFNNAISERQYKTTTYDCDDYATDLKLAAEEDGYRMDIQWDLSGRFDPTGKGQPHALNSTRIGNTVYIIEPQTDAIVYEGRID